MSRLALLLLSLYGATALTVVGELPQMYKARWAGEAKSPTSPPVMVPSLKGNMIDWFDGADADAACLDIFDKQGMVKKNARDAPMLCGEISFDSAEDGMVCIEDYSSGKLRWVCE